MDAGTEDAQVASLLFSLPAEIRAYVFELALAATDDNAKPYRTDRKYYRPGYHYHPKVDCALLRTCKRVYREARLLPVSVNEHVFWFFNGPRSSNSRINRNTAMWRTWYDSLSEDQKQSVRTVHIFCQQVHLERLGNSSEVEFSFRTSRLRLTIRHADWWSWESPAESSDRLGICPWRSWRTSCQEMLAEPAHPSLGYIKEHMIPQTWGGQICQMQGLKVLVLEFETDEEKKAQLEAVVERAKYWKFPLTVDEAVLEWTGELKESSWDGLRDLRDDSNYHAREKPPRDDLPRRRYYVVKMSWKAASSSYQ